MPRTTAIAYALGQTAALRLKTPPVDEKVASDVATAAMIRALLAEEQGNFVNAVKEWDLFRGALGARDQR